MATAVADDTFVSFLNGAEANERVEALNLGAQLVHRHAPTPDISHKYFDPQRGLV